MFERREFMQLTLATAAMTGLPNLSRAAAHQSITQDDILSFEAKGQVTLMNLTDIHAQIVPVYFREPSINLGVGEVFGLPPHLTGDSFLSHFGIKAKSPHAYMLTAADFEAMARSYGRVGGLDRIATLVKAIRAERGNDRCLLLDGGDTWHGSFTALETRGQDMVDLMNLLEVDAMTGHWEFTLGDERVQELVESFNGKFLAQNIRDNEWDEEVFEHTAYYEKGGVKIAVIGQAFPYTPVANPRYMIPGWSFGIREDLVQERIDAARAEGAELVVLLSHNGFDVDRKLASRLTGLDVLMTGHTHDAIPQPEIIGDTLMIASGSNGKFLSRLDVKVEGGRMVDYSYKLMPILSDVITPDPEMAAAVVEVRAPYASMLATPLATTQSLLYRRGNFNGTFDDLLCQGMLEQRDAEIALSPGFRWGTSLLPGMEITNDDLLNQTAMTYPAVYRLEFSGQQLKDIFEDVADNLFNPDPYYQQGGDMVRVGGMGYTIDVNKTIGNRITNMILSDGTPVEASRSYVVAGWASVNEGTEGPAIWDLMRSYFADHRQVDIPVNDSVKAIA
jgi:sulfur-oxidizing protein SoxB